MCYLCCDAALVSENYQSEKRIVNCCKLYELRFDIRHDNRIRAVMTGLLWQRRPQQVVQAKSCRCHGDSVLR